MSDYNKSSGSNSTFRAPRLILSPSSGPTAANASTPPLFDFGSVLRLMRRRLGLILMVTSICVLIAVFLSAMTPKVYGANTRILLDEQNINPFGNDEIFADRRLTNPVIESQMQLIRSPYLLSQVVNDLDLANNSKFLEPPATALATWIDGLLSNLPSTGEETVEPPTEAQRFQASVEQLRDNLRVTRNAQTLVIQIQFSSSSPALAAEIVNAVADAYINDRLGVRQESAQEASEWFDERIGELNVRALETEQQMQRLSAGGVDALDASESAATLQAARTTLQAALADRSRAETEVTRLQTIVESGRGLQGVPTSLATDSILSLQSEVEDLEGRLSEARGALPTDTALIAQLERQIASTENVGQSLLEVMLDGARNRATDAEAAVATAQQTFEGIRDQSGGSVTNAIEVELRTLEGEARIYRELHDTYLESYLRTIQQQSFPSTESTIIQTALPPEFPQGPGLRQLGLLAVLVGMTLGAALAFVLEAADGRVRTVRQLNRATGAPFLGILPKYSELQTSVGSKGNQLKLPAISTPTRTRNVHREVISLPENRVSLSQNASQLYSSISNPLSTFSESIRRVNVEVDNVGQLIGTDAMTTRIIGFVSDERSEGRSVSAANYAEMLAVGGRQTLLIDLDWTGMFLTEKITPAANFGLADLSMKGLQVNSEQAFWYDERTSLYFLPNRSMAKDATFDPAVFDQTRLKKLIEAISTQFDTIVIDLSPMSISSDAAAMAEIVSAFVAVADWGETMTSSLASELRRASIYPPKLIGTLLNGVSATQLSKYETAV